MSTASKRQAGYRLVWEKPRKSQG